MKFFYSILVSLVCFLSKAQVFNWVSQMGGSSTELAQCIKLDASGNIYTIGYFSGTVDFDPGASVFNLTSLGGPQDVFVSKLDPNGNFIWAKRIGGTGGDFGYGLALDASGNVYAVGNFSVTADFDPSASTYTMTSAGLGDIFVVKLTSAGNFVWAKQMGGVNNELAKSIVLDGSGNIHTVGVFDGTADFDPGPGTYNLTALSIYDIYINKLDPNGNFVWAKNIGSTGSDTGESIALDATNNVFFTGAIGGVTDFDASASTYTIAPATTDAFVCKYDAAGNFVWAKVLSSPSGETGFGITVDPSGNVLSTGQYAGTIDLDPGPGVSSFTTAGSNDIYISKLDNNGNYIWGKKCGGTLSEGGMEITTDGLGDVYLAGFFSGVCDFDPGPFVTNLVCSGVTDAFTCKLSSSGNFAWATQVYGQQADYAYSLAVSTPSAVFTTGYFSATPNFALPLNYTVTSYGLEDIFVAKYATCSGAPPTPGAISGQSVFCSASGAKTYTIPTVSSATLYTWTLPSGWTGSSTTNTIVGTPGTSGVISVVASNACGSSSAQVLNVTVNANPTITVNSGTICLGNSFTISPVGASTYTYLNGGPIISPAATGTYAVIGTSSAGCVATNTAISSVTVNTAALPTISVNSGSICNGSSFTINPNGANTYTIQGGNAVVSPTANASYTVIGTSTAGCVSNTFATSNITVNPLPTIAASSSTNQLCIGSNATLTASGGASYTWNPGGNGVSIVVNPTVNTTYTVTGTDANGCENSTIITQNVLNCTTGMIANTKDRTKVSIFPNPFQNKVFVKGDFTKTNLAIYNCLAELVYSSQVEPGNEIDLTALPTGIYIFKIAGLITKFVKQ